MPRKGELATPELKKMPGLMEWRRVARRYPKGITMEAGLAARVFADCFGAMQPGDMAIIALPTEKGKQIVALNAEYKACLAQRHTLQSSYQRLMDKGPWAMHRRDLFREGIEPLQAYEQALKHHHQRLEYLHIKSARLKEFRDDIEAELIRQSMEREEV